MHAPTGPMWGVTIGAVLAGLLTAPGIGLPAPHPVRRAQPVTLASALDVVAGTTGVWVLAQVSEVQGPSFTDRGSRLQRIDPSTGRVLRRFDLPLSAGYLTQGRSGRLWVSGSGLAVADPRTGRVEIVTAGACETLVADSTPGIWTASTCGLPIITRRRSDGRPLGPAIRLRGHGVLALALGVGGLYVARAGKGATPPGSAVVRPGGPGVLERRDPGTGRLLRRVTVGPSPAKLVLGGGSLWSLGSDAILRRIDPATLRTTARFRLPRTGSEWGDLSVGLDGPRVLDAGFGIARIDPRAETIRRIRRDTGGPRGMLPIAIAPGRRHVWVVFRGDGPGSAVCRMNADTDVAERCFPRS
ncbi:MAG: hypothetical protein IT200_16395 [Thermoleophilia bacterium]|nr:hypothetical protein [Thermoleophilia bacterium]